MTLTATDSRPRVSFESVPATLDESLPRMDVCAFVGFASSGPLQLPVVVEDVNRYRDVFGPDPELARTEPDGPARLANLGRAVDAFFANGGKRCWVVRVADDGPEGAVTNEFTVPGLVVPGAHDGTGWRLAAFRARAPGSWSDPFRASATLSVRSTTAVSIARREVVLDRSVDVVEGDLLRLDFGAGREALVVLDAVLPDDAGRRATWSAVGEWWFDPEIDLAEIGLGAAVRLTAGEPEPIEIVDLEPAEGERAPDSVPPAIGPSAVITVGRGAGLHARDVIVAAGTTGGGGPAVIVLHDEVLADVTSLPDDHQRFRIGTAFEVVPTPPDWAVTAIDDLGAAPPVVEVLRVNLRVWRGEQLVATLGGLGFGRGHPRSLAALPGDDELFALVASLPRYGEEMVTGDFAPAALTVLQQKALAPRFPLASSGRVESILPIGLGTSHEPAAIGPAPPTADPATTMERDGLAEFGAHLFLDEDLGRLGTDTLLDAAFQRAYVDRRPRRLRGIHAVVPLDEVTLLAAPDAVHPRWERVVRVPPAPLTAPVLAAPFVNGPDMSLRWSSVPGATGYEVVRARDAGFVDGDGTDIVEATTLLIEGRAGCPAFVFVRVRATRGDERGPWSNTETAYVPADGFVPCAAPPGTVDAEDAVTPAPAIVHPVATWVSMPPEDDDTWPELRAIHTAMVRVCASRGDVFALLSLPDDFGTAEALAHVGRLTGRAGHRLRTETEAADVGLLPVGVPTLDIGDEGALSYVAVYHPWIVTGSTERAALSSSPPDGAMAGVYAGRAIGRGAWVAPANQPITHALALTPTFDDADRIRLLDARINPLAREPRGFVTIGAETLSPDGALRPVNVRRLMILLRRLATREGATYVFRPNDGEFRRLVQMRFERVLSDLHRRGAFARALPDEAFQVATDASVNPIGGIEQGRFVVEIRVAPSQPMKFITVRLVMSGPDVVAVTVG